MKPSISLLITFFFFSTCFAQEAWTLKKCQETGIKNNLHIERQILNNKFNNINKSQYQATRLPVLSAVGNQNYGLGRSIDPTTNQFVQQAISSNNFSLNGNLILFNGLQNYYTIEQIRLQLEAGKLDILDAENDIKLSIANQYLQISLNEKQLEIVKIQVRNNEELVKNQFRLYKAEVQNESSYAAAKSRHSEALYKLTLIENQLLLSKLEMCQLMQIPYDQNFTIVPIEVSEDTYNFLPQNAENIFIESTEDMPQIKSAVAQVRSSRTSLKVARREYYPNLSMNFGLQTLYSSQNVEVSGVSYQLSSTPNGFVNYDLNQGVYNVIPVASTSKTSFEKQIKNNLSQYVSFQLAIPIYNQKQSWANVEKAKVGIDLAENNLKQTRNELRQEIEITMTNLKSAKAKYAAALSMYESNKLSYESGKKRLNAGVMSIYDFGIVQNAYQESELELIKTRYELFFRIKMVEFYQGDIE